MPSSIAWLRSISWTIWLRSVGGDGGRGAALLPGFLPARHVVAALLEAAAHRGLDRFLLFGALHLGEADGAADGDERDQNDGRRGDRRAGIHSRAGRRRGAGCHHRAPCSGARGARSKAAIAVELSFDQQAAALGAGAVERSPISR